MCNICNKKKCCCPKVITKEGPPGKPGKNGKDGSSGLVAFIPVPAPPVAPGNSAFNVTYTVPSAGNYILSFNCYISQDDTSGYTFTSSLKKNGALQGSNVNFRYATEFQVPLGQDVTSSTNETHTHVAMISAATGDVVGFDFICSEINPGIYQNIYKTGSLTIFKKTT